MRRFVVAGAPCSGKSSYVRQRAYLGDVIYDYNTLHGALSGLESDRHLPAVRPYVLAARDAVLAELERSEAPAWVITSASQAARVQQLAERLRAEVVLLDVPQSEAHRRCDADSRPSEWHEYIDNWYRETDIVPAEWAKSVRRAVMEHKQFRLASFKALDATQGIFEALVAVFGNIDRAGDRIMPGAFAASLQAWAEKQRPIPVIFAHEWDNLDAHIGEVLEARETDDGLYIKAQLEMDEPFAARVWKKMQRGTLAEFSFAYDILDSKPVTEAGRTVNELRELGLLEVGPCLVGMNPETQLLGVKNGRRNSANDMARIQAVHDLVCELGAKCGGGEGAGDDEGDNAKSSAPRPSTLAARIALELIEAGASD